MFRYSVYVDRDGEFQSADPPPKKLTKLMLEIFTLSLSRNNTSDTRFVLPLTVTSIVPFAFFGVFMTIFIRSEFHPLRIGSCPCHRSCPVRLPGTATRLYSAPCRPNDFLQSPSTGR